MTDLLEDFAVAWFLAIAATAVDHWQAHAHGRTLAAFDVTRAQIDALPEVVA